MKGTIYYGCFCNSINEFSPLYFHLDHHEYRASPKEYVVQTTALDIDGVQRPYCYFLVGVHSTLVKNMILGDSFLRNYYVYHDASDKTMGFYGEYMPHRDPPGLKLWIIILIAVGAGLILLSIIA